MSLGNQVLASEMPQNPARRKSRPRFPIDRRTQVGRRVAGFERDLVAAILARNGRSKGKPRPLDAEQLAQVRLACAYEALCARLEAALLIGEVMDTRTLDEALATRDRIVRRLTNPNPW